MSNKVSLSTNDAKPFEDESPLVFSDKSQGKTYTKLLKQLNHASVTKHYDAYTDIPWDEEDFQIRDTDPRWELPEYDSLGGTSWYRSQPQEIRIKLALDRTVERVKTGVIFESILKRGMLEFAATLPNRTLEFRYAIHECIEEAQHSLMFQEFVNRSGYDPKGLSGATSIIARYIIMCGKYLPELFFIFALGGEEPIDYEQQRQLKQQKTLHPLMKRMVQIHITEEGRHICFAKAYLRERVPELSHIKMFNLRIMAPVILGNMGKLFLHPPKQIIEKYRIPKEVIEEAYTRNPEQKRDLQRSMSSIIALCRELGILNKSTEPLWRKYSLIP